MVEAMLRCSKVPIICSNQCGRSHFYCDGSIECEYQRAHIEHKDARQSKGSAEQQTDNTGSPKLPTFEAFDAWVHSHGGMDNRNIYNWFVRQLWAGA